MRPKFSTTMILITTPALLLISGCRNACQDLCLEMAIFSEEECNQTFPEAQVDSCLERYKKPTDTQLDACDQYLPTLREEWTCDDLAPYFDGSDGGQSDTGSSDR